MMLYICSKFYENTCIFDKFPSFIADTNFIQNITKECNSEKNEGGVMVLVFFTLSDEALYLCQVS